MAFLEFDRVSKIFPGEVRAVDRLSLSVEEGEFLVLVGPSGCGKSTALRMIAGLETVTEGEIRLGGNVVNHLSPRERNVAMVFQNYALYPHMSVRGNLDFPLKMGKLDRKERKRRVESVAESLGLTRWIEQKPATLSGGQRQRVAMGRAMVREPALYLLDEPLSNLDAELRVQIRSEIARLQARLGTTTVYVTHDQVEAMTLGHRVAVLADGKLHQVGTGQQLYDEPANTFVAGFLGTPGMNLFQTTLRKDEGAQFFVEFGNQKLPVPKAELDRCLDPSEHLDRHVIAGLRPEAFSLVTRGREEHAADVEVSTVEALGHEILVYFEAPQPAAPTGTEPQEDRRAKLAARLPTPGSLPAPGETVRLNVDPSGLRLFDRAGKRI